MHTALGIIGFPIGHSISPVFQQAALDYCAIPLRYRAYNVHPEDIAAFVAELRMPGIRGINVTVPHKEAVIPFLDDIDDWAAEAGAVNTIVHSRGRLTGYNTDGYGFLRALREGGGLAPAGCRALILGAGGAARGVVLALARERAAHLTIANRTVRRAEILARLAQGRGVPAAALPLPAAGAAADPELAAAAGQADLIVNCTTIGMAHGPQSDGVPLPWQLISPGALVYDLVYNPPQTRLLDAAARAGIATLGGIEMLVYQGAASFELWLEQPAPVAAMLAAATRAMQNRS